MVSFATAENLTIFLEKEMNYFTKESVKYSKHLSRDLRERGRTIAKILSNLPQNTNSKIARDLGVNESTVRRWLKD